MDNENQGSGMSLGSIFRIIFSQKWIVLIILVAVTLAGTLGIYLGKNKVAETYEVSFTLELPQTGKEDTTNNSSPESVIYYPDGTPFYYTNIVSLTTLNKVKSSDEFKDIDINVEKMSKRGDIFISRETYETADNSGVYESIYKLSVKASYFHGNKDAARDFVVALTNTPIDYMRSMDIDYNVFINSAKEAPDYVTEVSQLISQANYLIERYNAFIELYNDLSVDGKTLRSYSQEINSYLNEEEDLKLLLAEARSNGYLKTDFSDKYDNKLFMLKDEYAKAKGTLDNLLLAKGDSESGTASSAAIIKAQSDLVYELKKQIEDIETYQNRGIIGDAVPQKFKDNLETARKQVQAFTDEFKVVVSELYSKVAVVSYSNSNVVVTSGVTGLIMSFVISLIAGLLVAMIVAFIVGWIKSKKAEKAAMLEQLQIEYKQPE